MKTFTELLENINSADKKAEIYTKPDGKKGTRMVPVDREVIKQEKTLEWLKSALAREAKATKPREDDLDEAYNMENMCCKNCGDMFGKPTKENKSCQYNAYEPKGKNWIKAEKQHEKVECPKCKGKGCDHCDNKGYHTEAKEAHDPKHVKQAVGIASDPRYKGGNMTGATKVINKLSKGLSDHPQVKAVLKRQNEGINELKKSTYGSYIKKAGPDAVKQTAQAKRHSDAGDMANKDKDMYKHYAKSQRAMDKAANRQKGIGQAVDKLTRESNVSELTIADVLKATEKAKKRQERERKAGKKSVSTADLAARMPKKESNVSEMSNAMKTFFQLRESLQLQEAKDKHNFTSAQHKAAADYHSKMAMAHHSAGTAHRMKHDEANNHHTKAQTAHADAYSFHNSAAAHKAGDKDESSRSVELAHKYSKKANRISANRKGTDIKVSDHWNTNKGKDHGSEDKPKSHPYGAKIPN